MWNQYRIYEEAGRTGIHLSGKAFMTRTFSDAGLLAIRDVFQAPDLKVTASLFIKRYCAYIGILEGMSRRNIGLSLSLSDLSFVCSETTVAVYTPVFPVKECPREERGIWRERFLTGLFRDHVAIMIDALARETKLSASIMWGHVAFYVHVMYRKWIQEEKNEAVRERLVADFQYLLAAPPELFGSQINNPLQMSFCKMKTADKEILLRRTCCLNYKAGTKGACYTCPRLTEQERIQQLQKYAAKA